MCRTHRAPVLCLLRPGVRGAAGYPQAADHINAAFDADGCWRTTRGLGIRAHTLHRRTACGVWGKLREPAVGQTAHAFDYPFRVGPPTQPQRDGALDGQWIEARVRNLMPAPMKIH